MMTCSAALSLFISFLPQSDVQLWGSSTRVCGSICCISYKTQAQDLFLRLIQNKTKVEHAVWMGTNGEMGAKKKGKRKGSPGCGPCSCKEFKLLPLRCWHIPLCLHSSDWNSGQSLAWTQPWVNAQFLVAQMPKFKAETNLERLALYLPFLSTWSSDLVTSADSAQGYFLIYISIPRPELHPCSLVRWERNE